MRLPRLKRLAIAMLLLAGVAFGQQQLTQQTTLSATGSTPIVSEQGGYAVHTIIWTTTGSPTGCTLALQASSTFTGSYTNVGAAQSCTASGSYTVSGTAPNYANVALSVLSGGTAPTVTITYFALPPLVGNLQDGSFYVPVPTNCIGATSGTAGTGNATSVLSGGAIVYRLSATAAGASNNTLTCAFQIPSRITAGRQITITDIALEVSAQTTIPTSITLPTVKTWVAPTAASTETANSATFVTSGGTITTIPTSAQFATFTAVTAGQFYTVDIILGTPFAVVSDYTQVQLVIVFAQSASAISIQEFPGFFVHYNYYPL